jgi:hypothetical protein
MSTSDDAGKASRDMQEFEAKILDAAVNATPEEQAAAKLIVEKSDITTVETISPVLAAVLFVELNKHNRDFTLSKAHVYASQMTAGYWRLVHQGLAFYPNKKLADGQHRLAAVFLSGTSQQFTVFRNFSEDAMQAIDIGKRRTAGDAFGLTKLVSKDDSKLAASIADAVMKYEHRRLHAKSISPSIYEIQDWAKANLDALHAAIGIVARVVRGDPVLSKTEAGEIALGLILGGYDLPFVEQYLDDIISSRARYPESPATDLHRQFRKTKERSAAKGKLRKEEKMALAFKGAALFYQKFGTGGLRWKAGKEPMPAPVPPTEPAAEAAE